MKEIYMYITKKEKTVKHVLFYLCLCRSLTSTSKILSQAITKLCKKLALGEIQLLENLLER